MKAISQDFKNAIKDLGRQIDAKIIYTIDEEEIELGVNDLNSITPHYEGGILKSVMKQLDIDSNTDIPVGTILEAKFGLLVNGAYEYISFGNFIVYSSEKQEDLHSYKIVCYDKMLYSMKDYEDLGITYPITIRNYINAICTHLGLTFASISDDFVNYNREIPNELYLDADGGSLDYTFRDVLDDLAQATASTICINDDDELEVRYINQTIGKNLLNVNSMTTSASLSLPYTTKGITFSRTSEGVIHTEGTKTEEGYATWSFNHQRIVFKANQTYYIAEHLTCSCYKLAGGWDANRSGKFTPTEDIYCERSYITTTSRADVSVNFDTYLMIVEGETKPTFYEPYGDTIDEEYLKDINVNFGEKYGAVNTISLKRSADADVISKSIPENLPDDEKIEIAISDNQILNGNNRADYIDGILNKLYGLEYYINDYVSTGITYYDLCDRYNVSIDGNIYPCLMLNDEINITQGLVENIYADAPDESKTEYNKTSKDDRTINRTTLIVDKQNQTITALATKTEQLEQSIEVLSADLDTNVVVIPTDTSNVPFTTKTYEIDYRVKYLGNPLTTGYTISTTDTHTGITTDITTLGKLKFSVSNSTAISLVDNKYTFTISYTTGGDTFTLTRSVMLSLIASESEQNVIMSDTAPSDTELLWYDTSTDELKRYVGDEWLLVNDFSGDISAINSNINSLSGTIQQNYNELNGAIGTLRQNVSTQFQQTTDNFTASISRITDDVNDKNSATNTRIDDIQSYLSYGLETITNPITGATATTGVITIGETNSDIKLKLANNILFFDVKGNNAGYLGTDSASNSKLYFVDANLLNSVRIGNYEFIPRTNGSLSFRKVE